MPGSFEKFWTVLVSRHWHLPLTQFTLCEFLSVLRISAMISSDDFHPVLNSGEKAAALDGNLITSDELLMMDGTAKNKNAADCYWIFALFFSALLLAPWEKIPRFQHAIPTLFSAHPFHPRTKWPSWCEFVDENSCIIMRLDKRKQYFITAGSAN